MEWLHAFFLGLMQGITEFLPISSSGHLVLMPHLLGWQDQGLVFDVAANTGTLVAVMLYFRQEIKALIQGFWRSLRPGGRAQNEAGHLAWAVVITAIPVGVVGFFCHGFVATWAREPVVIGAASVLFGLALWLADQRGTRHKGMAELTLKDAMWVGIGQIFALIPGASRSGVTMTVGLLLGYNREAAARFSFLMAIPVGIMAGGMELLELVRHHPTLQEWAFMAVGFLVAMLSALLVIHWLLDWLKSRDMTPFVLYRLLLGVLIFTIAA